MKFFKVTFIIIFCISFSSGWANTAKLVEHVTVSVGSVTKTIQLLGVIKAHKSSGIKVEIPGVIEKIYVKDGTSVKKDAILVVLKNKELVQQYRLAQNAARLAQKQYKRIETLKKSGVASDVQLEQANEKLISANMHIVEAKKLLEQTILRAPFAGRVGAFKVTTGESVKPGDELVTMDDRSGAKVYHAVVEFYVPDDLLSDIQKGQVLSVGNFKGHVTAVERVIDVRTGMALARGTFDVQGEVLIGKTVNVDLVLAQQSNVLMLPKDAVFQRAMGYFVFLIKDGKAMLTPVKIGLIGDKRIVVKSGLKKGEKVVLKGQSILYPSQDIKLKP